ncbi:hypothetical protein D3C81_1787090 [compost metagenome]
MVRRKSRQYRLEVRIFHHYKNQVINILRPQLIDNSYLIGCCIELEIMADYITVHLQFFEPPASGQYSYIVPAAHEHMG